MILNKIKLVVICATLVLTACGKSMADAPKNNQATVVPTKVEGSAKPVSSEMETAKSDSSAVLSALKKGQDFNKARALILQAGWKSKPTSTCAENTPKSLKLCITLPETETCSGDGYCNFNYEDAAGHTLGVTGYGAIEYWNTNGRENEFSIDSWEVSHAEPAQDKPSAVSTSACPAIEFPDFVKAFRNDVGVQKSFTQFPLKMSNVAEGETAEEDFKTVVKMRKMSEVDFPLIEDEKGLKAEGAVSKNVHKGKEWIVSESRKGTDWLVEYHFVAANGCWKLVFIDDQSL